MILHYTTEQAERMALAAPAMLTLCHDLHALLWHYELKQQSGLADWGDPVALKQEYIKRLETIFAQVEGKK